MTRLAVYIALLAALVLGGSFAEASEAPPSSEQNLGPDSSGPPSRRRIADRHVSTSEDAAAIVGSIYNPLSPTSPVISRASELDTALASLQPIGVAAASAKTYKLSLAARSDVESYLKKQGFRQVAARRGAKVYTRLARRAATRPLVVGVTLYEGALAVETLFADDPALEELQGQSAILRPSLIAGFVAAIGVAIYCVLRRKRIVR